MLSNWLLFGNACVQVREINLPTCLVTRSTDGVAFDSGDAFIKYDFDCNLPLREFVLAMQPPLPLRVLGHIPLEPLAGSDRDVPSTRHNRARRHLGSALKYKSEAEQSRWQGVAEGRDSWRHFFYNAQIAKLVTRKIAIFSSYDHIQRQVQVGKFTVCSKGVAGWRCTCPDRTLTHDCVHLPSISHLEATKDEPLFDGPEPVLEVEPGILWLVQDQGTAFKAVFLDSAGTVCNCALLFLIIGADFVQL